MTRKHLSLKQIFKVTLLIVALIFLSGCSDVYNLSNFVVPDDLEFIEVIEGLNTPKKICEYMGDNFTPSDMPWWQSFSPYVVWVNNVKTKFGDCNDYGTFGIFVANWHGYEVAQILLWYKNEMNGHMIWTFVENGKINYASNYIYRPIQADTFKQVVDYQMALGTKTLKCYLVYDYYMNFVESEYF